MKLRYVQSFDSLFPSANESPFLDWYIPQIEDTLDSDESYTAAVVGKRRKGKSALFARLAELLDPTFPQAVMNPYFDPENKRFLHHRFYYKIIEFMRDYPNLRRRNVVGFDEAGVSHDAHFWRRWEAELFKQMAEMWAYKQNPCFYMMPDLSFLQRGEKLLCDHVIIIYERGYARVYSVEKDFVGGSWRKWGGRELKDWDMPQTPGLWDFMQKRKDENFSGYMQKALKTMEMRTAIQEAEQEASEILGKGEIEIGESEQKPEPENPLKQWN